VIIDGPMARIAAAAGAASRAYRPFTAGNVTEAMKAQTFTIFLRPARPGASCLARHVVLQPVGARGLEGVLQPIREDLSEGATFDQLPDGDFQVVVAGSSGEAPTVRVSTKDRAKLETAAGVVVPPTSSPAASRAEIAASRPPPAPSTAAPTVRELRLLVNGDRKHVADAIAALRNELQANGVRTTLAQPGEPYAYRIVLAEGDRNAAAAVALDARGEVVVSVVRSTFSEKGASEGAARDLAKKLAAIAR
jgi:hypothetical protein